MYTIEQKEGDLLAKVISISVDSNNQMVQSHQPTFISTTARDDVEAYPETMKESQDETTKEKRSSGTLSRTKTAASSKDPGPPPDGGVRAWTQVLVGHLIIMNTWYVPRLS